MIVVNKLKRNFLLCLLFYAALGFIFFLGTKNQHWFLLLALVAGVNGWLTFKHRVYFKGNLFIIIDPLVDLFFVIIFVLVAFNLLPF